MLFLPLALLACATPLLLGSAAPEAAWVARDGELDDSMQEMQAGIKGLERALGAKDAAKALSAAYDMQKAVQAAKLQKPAKVDEIADPKDKEKFLRGFRLKLIDLQRALLDVEANLVEGKIDEAKKLADTRLKALKKEGHDTYKD